MLTKQLIMIKLLSVINLKLLTDSRPESAWTKTILLCTMNANDVSALVQNV